MGFYFCFGVNTIVGRVIDGWSRKLGESRGEYRV